MEPIFFETKDEEAVIQDAIIKELLLRRWHVMVTHGNLYQRGFPDLRVSHPDYGARWLEVKRPEGYAFTKAQLEHFPKMCSNGDLIWIATTHVGVEDVLMQPYNWYQYLKVVSHNSVMVRQKAPTKYSLVSAILKNKGGSK